MSLLVGYVVRNHNLQAHVTIKFGKKLTVLNLCCIMVCFLSDPTLSALVYIPNDVLQETCANFAARYAFSELNGEEEKEEEGAFKKFHRIF